MPELEHLTMRLAGCFGIETALCGLISLEDHQSALIVRRMDRMGGHKLAMEDMCQLTDRLTEEKYRGSLESIGRVILHHCTNPGLDALRFLDVNLFCFLTGNADMHLKNFSLLRTTQGEIRLAPAYDLLPTGLLLPEDTEECALTLHGKKNKIRREDFLALGLALGLTERQVTNVFNKFGKSWVEALSLLERGHVTGEINKDYRQLMESRWARLQHS
jgi:serine/threonine-protein kinase HipA